MSQYLVFYHKNYNNLAQFISLPKEAGDFLRGYVKLDILPIPKGRGFWYQQTSPDCSGLTGSPPMVDAPTI